MQNNEQRSEGWHLQRHGKFTASEIYKLMGIKGLGETGKSYAIDKAIEQLYGDTEESFISYDMQRGIELEPLAFAKFKQLKSLEFIEVENCSFFEHDENSGASPDGLVGKEAILEIKCPKNSNFFRLVAEEEISKPYYYQMQMQMMCTGRKFAYFFNYIVIDGTEFYHTIKLEADEEVQELMKSRIQQAVEIKNEYINKLKQNKQWK